MGEIVDVVRGLDVEAGSLKVVYNQRAENWRRVGRNDERLADDVRQIDGLLRGQAMIAREHHEQRLGQHPPVG